VGSVDLSVHQEQEKQQNKGSTMKLFMCVLALWVLAGCEGLQTRIQITEDGCEITSPRKLAVQCEGSTVATGEIGLSQDSIQALAGKID